MTRPDKGFTDALTEDTQETPNRTARIQIRTPPASAEARITGSLAETVRPTRSPTTAPQPDGPDPGVPNTGAGLRRPETLHPQTAAEAGYRVGARAESIA